MDGVRPSKQERQAPVITGRALLDVHLSLIHISGMMKSMEQIYPASCCADTANSTSASFSRMAYTRLAEQDVYKRQGQHYAVDLVGAGVQIKTGELHLIIRVAAIGGQLHGDTLHGGLGGVDLAKLPLAVQQVIPCGDVVGRGLAEIVVSVALVFKQGIHTGIGGGGLLTPQLDRDVIAVGIGDLLCILQRPRGCLLYTSHKLRRTGGLLS